MSSPSLPSSVPPPPPPSERNSSIYNLAQLYRVTSGIELKVRLCRLPMTQEGELLSEGLHELRDELPVDSYERILLPVHRSIAPMRFTYVQGMIDPDTGSETVAIVSPFYNDSIMQRLRTVTQQQKIEWMLQICEAVEALHRMKVVHGNIHPNNIFIHHDGYAVLTDACLYSFTAVYYMRHLPDDMKDKLTLPATMACKRRCVSSSYERSMIPTSLPKREDDVFALAVTLCMLFEGFEGNGPWQGNAFANLKQITLHGHRSLGKPARMSNRLWETVNGLFPDDSVFEPTSKLREIKQGLENM